MSDMTLLGAQAKHASRVMARADTARKNDVLRRIADGLIDRIDEILGANARDIEHASAKGVAPYFIDRLTLNEKRLRAIAGDVLNVAALPDPVGEQYDHVTLPNGLRVHKRRIPLGVLGVIYESRPNVTIDIAALAIKSGNACILRGGSETIHSNRALVRIVHDALSANDLPCEAVSFVDDTDRARIMELLRLSDYVDLIIPRGGAALHDLCRKNSTIPVITGGMGINHIYVDDSADPDMALDILFNAKVQKPTVCNALGTAVIHSAIAEDFIPKMAARLGAAGVSFRCDPRAHDIFSRCAPEAQFQPAQPEDWDTEWLSLVAGVTVVDSLDEAIAFIEKHSVDHSDGIVSRNPDHIARFVNEVDSCGVFVNASTRFNDGGQFGLGAEVAISTQRIHARGPMGLRELTSYKWVVEGNGHVRPG
ncbi:MAG: glutamate-5-semialdehyde dehydrogenase [Anaerolineae bacterium]|nr:glutamate-5-semialdehyde dehydrogenase [Thermoflexales bacterium]MDW8407447.1 glutamate-5-semialdehyde dehydrogenase [Anaerolineae bacterium]